jgi:hypothetical protein
LILSYSTTVSVKKIVSLENEPLHAQFDHHGNLWITNNSQSQLIDILDASFTLKKPIALPQTKEIENMFELYEISQMRKWSSWNPDGILHRPVDEEAMHHKQKKTKRGGVKQQQKKLLQSQELEKNTQ